jgi:cysteine-S-conjugate beta-lyase
VDYKFDDRIDRAGTSSVKWQFMERGQELLERQPIKPITGEDDLLPLWVADMDFRSPQPVVNALVSRAEHGIYGYTAATQEFYASVVGWMRRRQGWDVQPEWILTTPGVVPAINMLVRTFTLPGDKVLLQPPVYFPFFRAIENNGAQVAANPLTYRGGRYEMDFTDLAAKARDPRVKLAILCSPHNPVGRVWTGDELTKFAEICIENDVLIISDEIHGDLVYKGHQFTPLAGLSERFARNSIICTAPSKTFNLAGLHTSCIISPNPQLRDEFNKTLQANGLLGVNAFGLVALQAAYDHGAEWLEQVLAYTEANLEYLQAFVLEHVPQVKVVRPEGTYLVWLDCRSLGVRSQQLQQILFDEVKVYLEDGSIFGAEGEGFLRINIACPRSILMEALQRTAQALSTLPARTAKK